MIGVSWGAMPGDLNGDGAVGIPEAIHALQVASGVRQPQEATPYDMAEYIFKPDKNDLTFREIAAETSAGDLLIRDFGYHFPSPRSVLRFEACILLLMKMSIVAFPWAISIGNKRASVGSVTAEIEGWAIG